MLSVYWFLIIFISAAAIVYMVFLFYNHPYDVRELEANVLANKVADCVSRGGELVPGIFDENRSDLSKDNFWENCGITFDNENVKEGGDPQYYSSVQFYDIKGVEFFGRFKGNLNLLSSCELQQDKEYEKLATCVEKRLYVVEYGEQYLVRILSIVRKTEKNVKL